MNRVWTPLCARMGIDVPIFGFAHDVQVVAAITNAGGYGVYGATRRFPHEIKEELKQIRALVGDKPFGVDLVPPGMPTHNSRDAIEAEIPQEHRDFVKQLTDRYEPLNSASSQRAGDAHAIYSFRRNRTGTDPCDYGVRCGHDGLRYWRAARRGRRS